MFDETSGSIFQITCLETAVIKRDSFKERLKANTQDRIIAMQKRLQTNDMKISSLTDKELDEMIALYRAQINEKKKYLNS